MEAHFALVVGGYLQDYIQEFLLHCLCPVVGELAVLAAFLTKAVTMEQILERDWPQSEHEVRQTRTGKTGNSRFVPADFEVHAPGPNENL